MRSAVETATNKAVQASTRHIFFVFTTILCVLLKIYSSVENFGASSSASNNELTVTPDRQNKVYIAR